MLDNEYVSSIKWAMKFIKKIRSVNIYTYLSMYLKANTIMIKVIWYLVILKARHYMIKVSNNAAPVHSSLFYEKTFT